MSEKLKFIINNISRLNDHSQIIQYINSNNINYSENNNGIFFNIELLDEIHINNIYNILNTILGNEYNPIKYNREEYKKLNRRVKKQFELIKFNHSFSDNEWDFINKTKLNNI